MNKYSNKLKNPFVYLILRSFSQFLGQKKFSLKIWLCHAQLHMGFKHHAKIYKKLMIQFKGKVPTDRTTDGRTDGRTDEQTEGQTRANIPYFLGPFWLPQVVQKTHMWRE